ncbi:PAB-dependent poly(A)-specific ribonuclease subunit 3 [Thoreauomyces humboldtii]|nr:PAB-dependent poly(A)-specific ribonuclease subunit 3 [Thoreauomyces humboldtii]
MFYGELKVFVWQTNLLCRASKGGDEYDTRISCQCEKRLPQRLSETAVALVFVYDYHPLSTTLSAKYFSQALHGNPGVPEKNLWSFITQLASALKTIHSAGLAACIIEPSKILITGKNRIRLNCCGIFDMLAYDGGKNVPHHQVSIVYEGSVDLSLTVLAFGLKQEDLLHFGQLIVALACGSLAAVHNLPKSIEYIVRHYSMDMKNVILYLLSKPSNYKSIDDVVTMIGPRILHEINSAHQLSVFCRECGMGFGGQDIDDFGKQQLQ